MSKERGGCCGLADIGKPVEAWRGNDLDTAVSSSHRNRATVGAERGGCPPSAFGETEQLARRRLPQAPLRVTRFRGGDAEKKRAVRAEGQRAMEARTLGLGSESPEPVPPEQVD